MKTAAHTAADIENLVASLPIRTGHEVTDYLYHAGQFAYRVKYDPAPYFVAREAAAVAACLAKALSYASPAELVSMAGAIGAVR